MNKNVIYSINGPVVSVANADAFAMLEMVYVGNRKLIGEVISIKKEATIIQVYESTTGLKPGEPVFGTGAPISVTLGPGILRNIFDGIERPLKAIAEQSGTFIATGSNVDPLDMEKLWDVTLVVKVGDIVEGGQIYATIPETDLIEHRCMVHPNISGEIIEVANNGKYKMKDVVAKLKDSYGNIHELTLMQKWPIKKERPVKARREISVPLITGQRVIDTLFPIAKGGTAAVPGGFGTGKTMTQHQLAKWCDADIIVYVGCGERGNEMTQVLEEFSELIDPKSQKPLTDRTVLIANTSNMPVAAREASIYTGI
ncbi:MAG: V-type ATP synthase subunit A, partial [Erysipelotrichaceae bacterium]